MSDPNIAATIEEARNTGMTVVTPSDGGDYERSRQIHNARIQNYPVAIAYCRHSEDVSFWFRSLDAKQNRITVRSGGHHHEGMSVGTDAVVLDLSEIAQLEIDSEKAFAWIGAGKKLGQANDELAAKSRIIPTGGCATVCVGGLTHGGGWGISYRDLGLTVDKLVEVEMVLPNGDIVSLNKDGIIKGETTLDLGDSFKDLFWALRGGGGGNFGVVTRFRFELSHPSDVYCGFLMHWKKADRLKIAVEWARLMDSAENALTAFCRLTLIDSDEYDENNPAVLVGGRYYGDKDACKAALKPLWGLIKPELFKINETPMRTPSHIANAYILGGNETFVGTSGTPLMPQAYALQVGARSRTEPLETCVPLPEPHKVSSAMPAASEKEIMECVEDYLLTSPEIRNVNANLSMHGMGGQGRHEPPEGTAFPWRDKTYMLQAQAWWLMNTNPDWERALEWVDGFRDTLEKNGCSDGAFINFPDRAQPVHTYYGSSFGKLRQIKGLVDPDNIMRFDMGIPPG